jgi:molecular chaperone DnaK
MSEKALKDAGDKISVEERKNIEDKIAALNDAKKSEDVGIIKKVTEELSSVAQKIGEILYKQQQQAQKPTAEGEPRPDGREEKKEGEEPKAGEEQKTEEKK